MRALFFFIFIGFLSGCGHGPKINVCLSSVERQEFDCADSSGKNFVRSFHAPSVNHFVCTPAKSYGALLKDGCVGVTIPLCLFSLEDQTFACVNSNGNASIVKSTDAEMNNQVCTYYTDYQILLNWLKNNC